MAKSRSSAGNLGYKTTGQRSGSAKYMPFRIDKSCTPKKDSSTSDATKDVSTKGGGDSGGTVGRPGGGSGY